MSQSSKTRRLKDKVFARDGYRCVYCGTAENLVIDHYLPTAAGGGNAIENLVTSCHSCNSQKGGIIPKEFRDSPFVQPVRMARMHAGRCPDDNIRLTLSGDTAMTSTGRIFDPLSCSGCGFRCWRFGDGHIEEPTENYDQCMVRYQIPLLEARLESLKKIRDRGGL